MTQYGESLVTTIAHSTSAQLLHQDRIELAVIATNIASYEEISGVVFYDQAHEILATAGNQAMIDQYTANAAMGDTITGYVSIALEPAAFQPDKPWLSWLATLVIVATVPFIAVLVFQFTQRGNRSLPIISVPEPTPDEAQESFCLTLNLYNAVALGKHGSQTALEDSLQMAQEVCALHPGFATIANSRGSLLLFDRVAVSANQAICAGFLLLELLSEYETNGEFRCYLHTCQVPRSPADLTNLDLATLGDDFDFEHTLTMAALAKPMTLLLSDTANKALNVTDSEWTSEFTHPMLDEGQRLFIAASPPAQQANLIASQKTIILGFTN